MKNSLSLEKTYLGVELGSTRIKAVLTDEQYNPVASGAFEWENKLEGGLWTYHLDDVWTGIQAGFKQLADEVESKYGQTLTTVGCIGVSAMMHGYLPFDKEDRQLAGFRTWRNTNTEEAAAGLTEKFAFNIPQRWSIAHLYQAMLNGESHVSEIAFLTTLAGYVHYKLTGEKVLGVGDASGMLPIDSTAGDYNARMVADFNGLAKDAGFDWTLEDILPKVLDAGQDAGVLTEEGAKLLDPAGRLKAGIPLCPPEGDAGTGMVATNSVARRTGNVSAGTSIFAMIVLEKELSKLYTEIDMVTTPSGAPVAMVHCNSFTSDLDAWVRLFGEAISSIGASVEKSSLYDVLYRRALEGDADCGGLLSYNYYSGEPITNLEQGRPLFVRTPDSAFTLANFMRSLLFSAIATLKIGMDILTEKENVTLDQLLGHGGFFKTKEVGQLLMASALNVPVAVMESAGEGGAWGVALLAAYRRTATGETLEKFLSEKVFRGSAGIRIEPDQKDHEGFNAYMRRYIPGLAIERAAVDNLQ
jgi:sugar (pentulose or hexulose) kinase